MKKNMIPLIIAMTMILISSCKEKTKTTPTDDEKDSAITLVDNVPSRYYWGIQTESKDPTTVGRNIYESFQKLMKTFEAKAMSRGDIGMGIFINYNDRETNFITAIPMDKGIIVEKNNDGIRMGRTFSGPGLKAIHTGDQKNIQSTYDRMKKHADEKGWILMGPAVEIYLTDQEKIKDTSLWKTEIYLPVETNKNGDVSEHGLPEMEFNSVREIIRASAGMPIEAAVGKRIGEINQMIMGACEDFNLFPPFYSGIAIFHKQTKDMVDLEFCVLSPAAATSKAVKTEFKSLSFPKAIRGVYHGNFTGLPGFYATMDSYVSSKSLKTTSQRIEVYMNDPRYQSDPSKWVTHVYYPIQ